MPWILLICLIPIAVANVVLNIVRLVELVVTANLNTFQRVVMIAKEPLIHYGTSLSGSCITKFPSGSVRFLDMIYSDNDT